MNNFLHRTPQGFARDNKSTYTSWQSMLARCRNPNATHYKYYGGRGIKVCERWLNSFAAFICDMGIKKPGMSLDRIDNNLGYTKENCRWIPISKQSRNRRFVRYIVFNGKSQTAHEWAVELNIPYGTIMERIYKGYGAEKILSKHGFREIGWANLNTTRNLYNQNLNQE